MSHVKAPADIEPLLSENDVSKLIHRAASTMQKDRVAGRGVPFLKVGRRCLYRPTDVRAWIEEQPLCRSTSDYPPTLPDVE